MSTEKAKEEAASTPKAGSKPAAPATGSSGSPPSGDGGTTTPARAGTPPTTPPSVPAGGAPGAAAPPPAGNGGTPAGTSTAPTDAKVILEAVKKFLDDPDRLTPTSQLSRRTHLEAKFLREKVEIAFVGLKHLLEGGASTDPGTGTDISTPLQVPFPKDQDELNKVIVTAVGRIDKKLGGAGGAPTATQRTRLEQAKTSLLEQKDRPLLGFETAREIVIAQVTAIRFLINMTIATPAPPPGS